MGDMGSERTDAIRRAHEAWNQGDFEGVRSLYADDITADAGVMWPSSGTLSGKEPIIERFASIRETFEDSEVIPDDYIERGDTVIVPTRWRGVVGGSTIEQHVVAAYTFRGPQVSHIAYYDSLDAAFEALEGAEV
jgi:ketosteroid isomerase-like protein